MSGESVEDQFKKFLADNKIDVSALSGTKEEGRFYKDVEDQRALGIVKAVRKNSIGETPNFIIFDYEWLSSWHFFL